MKNLKIRVLSALLIFACLFMFDISNVSASNTSKTETINSEFGEGAIIKSSTSSINTKTVGDGITINAVRGTKYLPNYIYLVVTPQASSWKIKIVNLGVDTIQKCTFTCRLYTNTGKYLAYYSRTVKNVKPGNTTYTWNIKKQATVQETLKLSGSASDSGQSVNFGGNTYRYNFAGGKYGTMKSYDGQRHHIPSNSVSPLSTYSGPCIRMITADHKKTSSYGSSTRAVNFRNKEKAKIKAGKFLAAQQLGIDDVRNKIGSKYNNVISSMVAYTKSLGYRK